MVKAILHHDGEAANLRYFEYEIRKSCDHEGLPYANTVGLKHVIVAVEATSDTIWWELAISDNRSVPKLVIELLPAILGQPTRYINLYDCQIAKQKTTFSADSNQPLTELLMITAQGMEQSHSKAIYATKLRKTFDADDAPISSQTAATPEKDIVDSYFTDTEGTRIEAYSANMHIILHLVTRHRIGDVLSLNLNDPLYDFEYEGVLLKNDTLEGIKIEADIQRIPLKVVEPTLV